MHLSQCSHKGFTSFHCVQLLGTPYPLHEYDYDSDYIFIYVHCVCNFENMLKERFIVVNKLPYIGILGHIYGKIKYIYTHMPHMCDTKNPVFGNVKKTWDITSLLHRFLAMASKAISHFFRSLVELVSFSNVHSNLE